MPTRASSSPRSKQQVHTRLYKADVKELRRRARQEGVPWQTLLRRLVHEALQRTARLS